MHDYFMDGPLHSHYMELKISYINISHMYSLTRVTITINGLEKYRA